MADTAQTDLGVLEATPPAFTPEQVSAIAAELFGVKGSARDLGSERDQTFMIEGEGGDGVLKISNLGENPDALDIEVAALLHVSAADPDLPVARQRPRPGRWPNSGAGGLPAAVSRPRRPALRTAVRTAHGPLHGARPRAG